MNIDSTVGPNPEFPLRMQPRQRSLHNPTADPQPAAMLRTAPRSRTARSRAVAASTLRFRVIAPVAIQAVRAAARPTRLAAYRRDRLDQPPELRDLIHVGGGRRRGQRHAVPIGQDAMLAPLFPPVHRAGAGPFATAQGPHERRVDGRAQPIDLVGGGQLGQEDFVELLLDPGGLPVAKPSPAGHAAAAAHLPAAGTPTGCRS